MSTETMLQTHGYDLAQEAERREREDQEGVSEMRTDKQKDAQEPDTGDGEKKSPGRPELDDSERTSDKEKALTGKQPKPSSPDGSLD